MEAKRMLEINTMTQARCHASLNAASSDRRGGKLNVYLEIRIQNEVTQKR